MKACSILFAIALAGAATAANATNLVTSGSFETPSVGSNWAGVYNVPGWVNDTESTIELQSSGLGIIGAADGNQYMEINGTKGSYIHTTALNTVAGDSYTFSFDYAGRTGAVNNIIDVLWDGNVIQAALHAPSTSSWTYYSFTVVAQGNDTAGFSSINYNSTGAGNFIDNVSVTPTPLPAALLFVLPALAGVFGFSRRKVA